MNSLRATLFGLGCALAGGAGLPAAAQEPERLARIAVVELHSEIDILARALMDRAVDQAIAAGAAGLLLDLNTPGGRVDFMLDIADALDRARAKGIKTAVFISGDATSAGALIAMACDEIYMKPGSTIGSATPMVPGVEMDEKIQEKMISYVRTKFAARAEVTGQSPALAEAMVDPDVELIEVEVDGKRRLVSSTEFQNLVQQLGAHRVVQLGIVCPKGKLLALRASQAAALGVAKGLYDRQALVLAQVWPQAHEVLPFAPTWSEELAAWITSPGVQMLLFLVGIVAFYVELKSPGLSVPGLIGVVCFGLFFFGHHVVGLAQAWEALVFLLGLALLAVEIFVVPGFGVAGVTGVILMLGALIMAQVPDLWPGGAYGGVQWPLVIDALGRTTLGIALGVVGAIGLAWAIPHTPLSRFVTLTAPAVAAGLRGSGTLAGREAYVGKVGVAETDLRPAGRVLIGDEHLDVVTEGGYIERGANVTVVTTRGGALVVRGSP